MIDLWLRMHSAEDSENDRNHSHWRKEKEGERKSEKKRSYCRVIEIQLFHFADYLCVSRIHMAAHAIIHLDYVFVCQAVWAMAICFIMMIDQSNQVSAFVCGLCESHSSLPTLCDVLDNVQAHNVSLNSIKWFHFKPVKFSRTTNRGRIPWSCCCCCSVCFYYTKLSERMNERSKMSVEAH